MHSDPPRIVLGPSLGPAPDSRLSRRRVLVHSGRAVLAFAAVGTFVAACGAEQPHEPDPLESELAAARSDAALAAAAAQGAPGLAPALRVIADERSRHAAALVEELARAAGRPTPAPDSPDATSDSSSPGSPGSPGPSQTATPPVRPPGVREVAEALRRSADSAAKLAPTLSGYRAGLVGSIAAACAAAHSVGLAPVKQAR